MSEKILTTHVGSLPRPQDVVDVVWAQDKGEHVDPAEYERVIAAAVADRVGRQAEAGIDIVSDGEMSKIGYATYIRHRMWGFEIGDVPRATPADLDAYPSPRPPGRGGRHRDVPPPDLSRPDRLRQPRAARARPRPLQAVLDGHHVAGAFMNAPSPGSSHCSNPTSITPASTSTWLRSQTP